MFKILDCTLRDGGYYTNWDFNSKFVKDYLESFRDLPVDFLEVGYCSPQVDGYMGEYYYLPNNLILKYHNDPDFATRMAIMLNLKDFSEKDIEKFLARKDHPYSLIRVAVDPATIETVWPKLKLIKAKGFKVALNLMYLSDWEEDTKIIDDLVAQKDLFDFAYLVDSFGACYPERVSKFTKIFKEKLPGIQIGFHGHDNLSLAFANTLASIEAGVDIVDATILGMGRGAGNLKTEIILLHAMKQYKKDINLMKFNQVLTDLLVLKEKYDWGTNYAYMVSGMFSIPQKKVMSWLSTKRYNLTRIVDHLFKGVSTKDLNDVSTKDLNDVPKYEPVNKGNDLLIVGGGVSVEEHLPSLQEFINKANPTVVLSSLKYMDLFKGENTKVVLAGDEILKLDSKENYENKEFIVNQSTKMSPDLSGKKVFSVKCNYTKDTGPDELTNDSPLGIGLTLADLENSSRLFLVGFDGYDTITSTRHDLMIENAQIFEKFKESSKEIVSLVPTRYNIKVKSIYGYLTN